MASTRVSNALKRTNLNGILEPLHEDPVAAVSNKSLSSPHQHAPRLGSMPNMAVDEEQYDEVDYGIDVCV